MAGVYAATDFWWTLEDKYPLAKMFVEAFEKKYGYKPEWGANNAYMQFAFWANAVEKAGTFYPPDVIKSTRAARSSSRRSARSTSARKTISSSARSSSSTARSRRHEEQGGLWEVIEIVPGEPLMQKPDAFGCKLGDYT